MGKKQKNCGAKAFEEYYSALFGARWNTLKAALTAESKTLAYTENLKKTYYLDYASVCAAKALPPLESGLCLDMCAAPGGKTLVLSNCMGEKVSIQANEISAARRNRLIKVLDESLTESVRSRVTVTGFDGAKMAKLNSEKYDRILLDAPCSSERHVLNSPKHLNEWSPARIRNLNMRQWALLSSAFLMLKPGGFLVYSTCALCGSENDGVTDKLLKKYPEAFAVKDKKEDCAEETRNGFMYLPDKASGAGPIYFAVFAKARQSTEFSL